MFSTRAEWNWDQDVCIVVEVRTKVHLDRIRRVLPFPRANGQRTSRTSFI